jgi:hypothetical protein
MTIEWLCAYNSFLPLLVKFQLNFFSILKFLDFYIILT